MTGIQTKDEIFWDFITGTGILISNLVCSILSAIGSIIMIATYIFFTGIRSLIFRLILLISISELINSFAHFISFSLINKKDEDFIDSIWCDIQSVVIYFTDTLTLFYLTTICYIIYQLIRKNNKNLLLHRRKFFLFGLIFSFVLTLVIFISFYLIKYDFEYDNRLKYHRDVYLSWCSVRLENLNLKEKKKIIPQYHMIFTTLVYWVFVLAIMYFTFNVTYYILKKKRNNESNFNKSINKITKQILNYPLIGVGWIFFMTLNLIIPYHPRLYIKNNDKQKIARQKRGAFCILCIYLMFASIRGFGLFLIFINNTGVQEFYRKLITKVVLLFIKEEKIKNKIIEIERLNNIIEKNEELVEES